MEKELRALRMENAAQKAKQLEQEQASKWVPDTPAMPKRAINGSHES